MICPFIIVCLLFESTLSKNEIYINPSGSDHINELAKASSDIIEGFLLKSICICFDTNLGTVFLQKFLSELSAHQISTIIFNISDVESQDQYLNYLSVRIKNYLEVSTIFFSTHNFYEHILLEIHDRNYIRNNIIYIFFWGSAPFKKFFIRNIGSVAKIYAITNPRNGTYHLFFSQAVSHRTHHLELVNWWRRDFGLFNHPALPHKYKGVYRDFKGKLFKIPVIHKPPWHFVDYQNESFQVLGGRDDKILALLAHKLNFRYEYFDPPERNQGSAPLKNGTFKGVLGLIWHRDADFFIGDVALSYERLAYVEFSFITLADSGAFVTHAPSKLGEALALVRPFQWDVWPAILLTFLIVGPALYAIISLPNCWRPTLRIKSHKALLLDCTWTTTTVFLKQSLSWLQSQSN